MQPAFWPDQTNAHRLLIQVGLGRATASYKSKQKIYSQGEDAGFVYFVQEGRVKLVVRSEDGVESVLGIAQRGQFFGEACLHEVTIRFATATATDDSRITSVSKAAMLSALKEEPKFAKLFVDYLLDHNSWVQKHMIVHLLSLDEAA
jgi:CRP-like cAMP-binding protein